MVWGLREVRFGVASALNRGFGFRDSRVAFRGEVLGLGVGG